ncbi:H/ACA ribonucleoprotein complex subunit 2-like protein [Schistocerca gregaria]|uniref:H/ACA ribonucleoprotein complex subunit 2-like protein n=1 Tax=Schistocerca gregaria TaxID=7010 RepID=UPI00211EDFCE|nr:H/ACA ribonucleoprotein complex subunit 2-like protein [Schistocerca gregaria]
MGKTKKIKQEPGAENEPAAEEQETAEILDVSTIKKEDLSYDEKCAFATSIAKPMASRKLAKKLYKLIKKAAAHKTYLRNGLKDVQRRIRKGETGIVVLAGDVTPIDIMCHLPVVCEDRNIPYVYTPSRQDLGQAMGVKRSCIVMMVREHQEYKDTFDELTKELKTLTYPI